MGAAGLQVLEEWDAGLRGGDPLGYPGYAAQLLESEAESVVTGLARLGGQHAVLIESRFDRFGGTMGAAAGEKIARAFDQAAARKLPVIAVTATGGARLQEGMLALVQMGRTVAARGRHASAGLLMAAVYRSPTTGGVYASWASLADVRAGLTGATIGFGGPRVVEQVTGQPPPATSHTAESAYAAGQLDAVLPAGSEPCWLAAALGCADRPLALPAWRRPVQASSGSAAPAGTTASCHGGSGYGGSGSQAIRAARARTRPSGLEWAAALCSSWTDLHGTDPAIRAGLASIGGQRVVVIAMDRHARADAAARPGPAAYRLAQRAIRLAARLRLPLLTLVDTPGAEPGPAAEADGIAAEIAATIALMAEIPTVSVCVCVGEGGSGGAMALGYADRLLMLAGSVFSVIGPEAAAVILRRDPSAAPQVADALGITGAALGRLGLVDGLLPDGSDIPAVRSAILTAFGQATPGDRARRPDEATRRWLQASYLRTQP